MGMPTISRGAGGFPPLFQSIVRYRWDGEEAYGMMERSNLPERVKLPASAEGVRHELKDGVVKQIP